jgi:zinc/manganese transport system substrate-binding protein
VIPLLEAARRSTRRAALGLGALALSGWLAGCSAPGPAGGSPGIVRAVGAESEYADVIAQIGGAQVRVSAVMSNPDVDPHTFEASPTVVQELASARLVVQNGLGYDSFMDAIEAAQPEPGRLKPGVTVRLVVDVQHLLRLPDSTPNPHLWYDPATMPAVARAVAADLSELDPAHASAFSARLRAFDASLRPWDDAIATLRASYGGTAVATTEPVADDLLEAAGLDDLTPFAFQADVMNGIDPSPQAVATERALLAARKVRAFVYNVQVTDSLTASLAGLARQEGIPLVGVYETMPTGYHYQSWMLAEVRALHRALADGASTPAL